MALPKINQTMTNNQLLKQYLDVCFENMDTDLCKTPASFLNRSIETKKNCNRFKGGTLTFQKFYSLVHKWIQEGTNLEQKAHLAKSIFLFYGKCIQEKFSEFAKCLQENPSFDEQEIIVKLTKYWDLFSRNVLPFLHRVFMFAERIIRLTSDRMLFDEFTEHLFIQTILKGRIGHFLENTLINYQLAKHEQLFELSKTWRFQFMIDEKNEHLQFNKQKFFKEFIDKNDQLNIDLIRLIIQLSSGHQRSNFLYYKLFEYPFLRYYLTDCLRNITEHSLNEIPILTYVHVVGRYICLQTWLLEYLGFPKESIKIFIELYRFNFYGKILKQSIIHGKAGQLSFKSMLNCRSYGQMNELFTTIDHYYKTEQRQRIFLWETFREFIQNHLDERLKRLSMEYQCLTRQESLRFVQMILDEREHWDRILVQVFKNQHRFARMISKYYFDLTKINEHVEQALAYFMHQRIEELEDLRFNNQTNIADDEQINQLLFIIAFINDVNQFWDFCKHYFSKRLLIGKITNYMAFGKEFSLNFQQDLETLERMNLAIRLNLDQKQKQNQQTIDSFDEYGHEEPPQTPIPLSEKYFERNLNDFHNIDQNFQMSSKFFDEYYDSSQRSLKKCFILNAGIWKFLEFDRCWMPRKIVYEAKELERRYLKKFNKKKLLLNTKFSQVEISLKCQRADDIRVTMNLHQLAILWQFNNCDRLSYESIAKWARFRKQYNLHLALLSLIYCGLIRCFPINHSENNLAIEDFQFEINNEQFCQRLLSRKLFRENLVPYENVDFLNSELNQENVHLRTIVQLLTQGKDLQFFSSSFSVEDLNLINILNSNNSTNGQQNEKNRRKMTKRRIQETNQTTRSDNFEGSFSPLVIFNQRGSMENLQDVKMIESSASQQEENCLERSIKIEATIARVLKREKMLPSLKSVHEAVQNEWQLSLSKIVKPQTSIATLVSIEEVQNGLMQLIKKNYVKRNSEGAFEFEIN